MNSMDLMNRHMMTWMQDALLGGVLNNELLDLHNQVLKDRLKGLTALTYHRLTPELVSPQSLAMTLKKMSQKLSLKYRQLRLGSNLIHDFYAKNNVVSYKANNSNYISIPVNLEVRNQLYDLYDIETFPLPITNSSQATLITNAVDIIAVNEHYYFPISGHMLNEHCHGISIKTCDRSFVSSDIIKSPTCVSAVYQNNLKDIKRLCKIGIINLSEHSIPTIIDLQNSSILLINPTNEKIYSKCFNQRREEITQNSLVTINLQCFCFLYNDLMVTPLYAEQECVGEEDIQVTVNKHVNIVFIAYMLNTTIDETHINLNESLYNDFPNIEIPDYLEPLDMSFEGNTKVFDLEKVISLQRNDFKDTLFGKVSRNTNKIQGMTIIKIILYTVLSVTIILVAGWIIMSLKLKGFGHLLALGKLIKPVNSFPIQNNNDITTNDDYSLIWEILLIVTFILFIAYFGSKHISLWRKLWKTIAYPCFDVTPELLSNRQKVTLYLSSLTSYCYIDLDQFFAAPHDVTLIQSSTPITIELHKNCCSSYIAISHTKLCLQVGTDPHNAWQLANTINIPNYLRNVVDSILSQHFTMEILIGCNGIYRAFPVNINVHPITVEHSPM